MELKIGALAFSLLLLSALLIAQEGATKIYPNFEYKATVSSAQDAVQSGSAIIAVGEISRAPAANHDSGTENFKVVMSLVGPSERLGLATSPDEYAGEEQTQFLSLNSGESKKLEMKFAASNPGQNTLRILLYKLIPAQGCASSEREDCAKVKQELTGWGEAYVQVYPPAEPIVPVVAPTTQPFEGIIIFRKGWNMVSTAYSEVLMGEVAKVCGTRSYAWSYSQPSGYLKTTSLSPGTGYWVKASRDCKYEIPHRAILVDSGFQFTPGWHLVPGPSSAVSISDFLGDCEITSGPWIYNPTAGKYDYSEKLEPNKAYWVKSANYCTPLSSEKPPLPPS
ncbi:MAG: hypothetical protein WC588_00260 [Candidatus Micrarchaeia archaeon]